MQLHLFGTRGSFPFSGENSSCYGGNTSCVALTEGDHLLILDAGTGILRIPKEWFVNRKRIDILLTHLHIDHIQGLGFFKPLYNPNCELHIWGPVGNDKTLKERLNRYLSPPLFPVHFRDMPSQMNLHEIGNDSFEIGPFSVSCNFICHPGPTVAFRVSNGNSSIAYFPDHEPAIRQTVWEHGREWVSGADLAENVDILIHDSQYTTEEYATRIGWGHCTYCDAIRFANLAGAKKLILFHHDPDHTDAQLNENFNKYVIQQNVKIETMLAKEGDIFDLP